MKIKNVEISYLSVIYTGAVVVMIVW